MGPGNRVVLRVTLAFGLNVTPPSHGAGFSGFSFYLTRKWFGSKIIGRKIGPVRVCHSSDTVTAGLASSLRTLVAYLPRGLCALCRPHHLFKELN